MDLDAENKKVILLTNDDGYMAPGINALAKALKGLGKIFIVAPDRERSAIGHGLTFFSPLRMEKMSGEEDLEVYSCDGTPTDCVILGANVLLKNRVDLVVSGINRGSNMGDDITYSGTVAGALEATIRSMPALAVSLNTYGEFDYSHSARFARQVADFMLGNSIPRDIFFNLNIPALPWEQIKGFKLTRQGRSIYRNEIIQRTDPRGRSYYWISGEPPVCDDADGTDYWAVKRGYISLSPLHLSMNYEGDMKIIREMAEKLDRGINEHS